MMFEITPIGGCAEIGHNMTIIKTVNEWIIVDAGILFPAEDFYNLQYLIPNFDHLKEGPVTSLIITHGHEDHIGAVSHLLDVFPNLKIYASTFSAELLSLKANISKIYNYNENSSLTFNDITVHPIMVSHSIPETFGLIIQDKKKKYSIFHLSDFRYEKSLDRQKIKKLTQGSKYRLLMLDSTNILYPDKTLSEKDLIPSFLKIFTNHTGRILITLFPSNIYRLQTIITLAGKFNKKIAYVGRSVQNYVNLALKLKLIKGYQKTLFPENQYPKANRTNNLIVILSGCQGDFKGALSRVCSGSDRTFKLSSNDLLLFSSKIIPGNEKRISKIINNIYAQGAKIISPQDETIHTSGHGGQEDIKAIFKIFRPTDFIPVHGETYFLSKHIDFTVKNFQKVNAHLLTNFDSFVVDQNFNSQIIHRECEPPTFVLDRGVVIEKSALNQRRKLAQNGIIFISIKITGQKTINIKSRFLGLPVLSEDFLEKFHVHIKSEYHKAKALRSLDIEEELRIKARNYLKTQVFLAPLAVVFIHE